MEIENPRALFHLGVRQFSTGGLSDEGLRNLEKSSRLGYHTATYALGLIHLGGSATETGKEEGIRLLSEAKSSLGYDIHECRAILRQRCLSTDWWPNRIYHVYYPLNYTDDDHSDTCIKLAYFPYIPYGQIRDMARC